MKKVVNFIIIHAAFYIVIFEYCSRFSICHLNQSNCIFSTHDFLFPYPFRHYCYAIRNNIGHFFWESDTSKLCLYFFSLYNTQT